MEPAGAAIEISAFKHIVVPVGVIVGLGVAHIVMAVARYIERRDVVSFSLVHSIWSAVLFLLFVGLWWVTWGLRDIEATRWSFFSLVFLLIGPALLYYAVALLLPTTVPDERVDLGQRFESVARPFFICLSASVVWFVATETYLLQQEFLVTHRANQAGMIVLLLIGTAVPNRRVGAIIGTLFLVIIATALATFRATLG